MAVIEVPIVIRNDLEKVRNPPEFRHRIPKFLSAEAWRVSHSPAFVRITRAFSGGVSR